MRAKEFIINLNIPLNIKINGDGKPEIDCSQQQVVPAPVPIQAQNNLTTNSEDEMYYSQKQVVQALKPTPVRAKNPPTTDGEETARFVPPLQQKIELMKGVAGKQSSVFDQLVADDDDDFLSQ